MVIFFSHLIRNFLFCVSRSYQTNILRPFPTCSSLCCPQPLLFLIIVYHCSFSVLFLTELIFCNLLQVEGCDTVQNSFSPKTKKKEKKNCAVTSVSFDLPKINSVPSLCLSSYSPNRIYHTYMTLPKELGSWFRQRDWIQRISPKPCFSAL